MIIPSVIGVNPLQTTLLELGIVSGRVALLLRSAEIQPGFDRFDRHIHVYPLPSLPPETCSLASILKTWRNHKVHNLKVGDEKLLYKSHYHQNHQTFMYDAPSAARHITLIPIALVSFLLLHKHCHHHFSLLLHIMNVKVVLYSSHKFPSKTCGWISRYPCLNIGQKCCLLLLGRSILLRIHHIMFPSRFHTMCVFPCRDLRQLGQERYFTLENICTKDMWKHINRFPDRTVGLLGILIAPMFLEFCVDTISTI